MSLPPALSELFAVLNAHLAEPLIQEFGPTEEDISDGCLPAASIESSVQIQQLWAEATNSKRALEFRC